MDDMVTTVLPAMALSGLVGAQLFMAPIRRNEGDVTKGVIFVGLGGSVCFGGGGWRAVDVRAH